MVTNQITGNVVEFAQNSIKAKLFRKDYPLSSELMGIFVGDIFSNFMKFVYQQYYGEYQFMLQDFSTSHDSHTEKRKLLEENVFWWRLLYDISLNVGRNCVEEYISVHCKQLSKMPLAVSWLQECSKAIPKFYHIGYKYEDRVLIVTDVVEKKALNVVVYDPLAVPPKTNEIAVGTLLPLGGGMYFPAVDFYHFDYEARIEILIHFYKLYNHYINHSTMHEAFIHLFSAMLQVESRFHHENHHSVSPNSIIQ